jgi:hypothetical protein
LFKQKQSEEDPKINLRIKINDVIRSLSRKQKESSGEEDKKNSSNEKEEERETTLSKFTDEKEEEILAWGETLLMIEKKDSKEPSEDSAIIEIGSATYKELCSLLEEDFDCKFLWVNGKLLITLETSGPHGGAIVQFSGQIFTLTNALILGLGDKTINAPAAGGALAFNAQSDGSWRPRTLVGANPMPTLILEVK